MMHARADNAPERSKCVRMKRGARSRTSSVSDSQTILSDVLAVSDSMVGTGHRYSVGPMLRLGTSGARGESRRFLWVCSGNVSSRKLPSPRMFHIWSGRSVEEWCAKLGWTGHRYTPLKGCVSHVLCPHCSRRLTETKLRHVLSCPCPTSTHGAAAFALANQLFGPRVTIRICPRASASFRARSTVRRIVPAARRLPSGVRH